MLVLLNCNLGEEFLVHSEQKERFRAPASFGSQFGALIKKFRGLEGMSQSELADLAFGDSTRKSRISDIERGRVTNPHAKTVDSIVVALNIPPEEIDAIRFGSSSRVEVTVEEDGYFWALASVAGYSGSPDNLQKAYFFTRDVILDAKKKQAEIDQAGNSSKEDQTSSIERIVREANSFEKAFKITESVVVDLHGGELPVFRVLMLKSRHLGQSFAVLDLMDRFHISPDLSIFHVLVENVIYANDVPLALDRLQRAGLQPDNTIFSTIVANLRDLDEALRVIDLIESSGGKVGANLLSNLVSKSPNFRAGLEAIELFEERGVSPNLEVFESLLWLSSSFEEAASVLRLITNSNLKPSLRIYEALVVFSKDYEQAFGVWDEILREGLKPTIGVLNELLAKSRNLLSGHEVVGMMRGAGLRPNNESFGLLVAKCTSFNEAQDIIAMMEEQGVEPSPLAAENLADLASDSASAFEIVKYLSLKGLVTSSVLAKVVVRLSETMSAEYLLNWYFGLSKNLNITFWSSPLGSAIRSFSRRGRISDALRVASAFPHFDESRALYLDVPVKARQYFEGRYRKREEPRHASYALAKLFQATGNKPLMKKWAKIALKYESQPFARRADISKMIDGS